MTIQLSNDLKKMRAMLLQPLDAIIWTLVLLFFGGTSIIRDGDLAFSIMGAVGIVMVMVLVGFSVEVIIETIQEVKGLGTIVGFITNGPEVLCLIVGLLARDVLFAASTPLGSNIMNPLMLVSAALITGSLVSMIKTNPGFMITCISFTAVLAVGFFFIPEDFYLAWLVLAVMITVVLFAKRTSEEHQNNQTDNSFTKLWFVPAFLVLLIAGYVLDPVVSFTAEHSHAPKGVIGFFVLATLTSWPEFKSTMSLFRHDRALAAILNITVSNITNIWLAVLGVSVYLIYY